MDDTDIRQEASHVQNATLKLKAVPFVPSFQKVERGVWTDNSGRTMRDFQSIAEWSNALLSSEPLAFLNKNVENYYNQDSSNKKHAFLKMFTHRDRINSIFWEQSVRKYSTEEYSDVHHPSHIDLIGMGQNIATCVPLNSFFQRAVSFWGFFFLLREAVNTICELHLNGKMLTGTVWWFSLILHILCAAANSSCHKFWTAPQHYISDSSMVCPRLPQNRNDHLHKPAAFQWKTH